MYKISNIVVCRDVTRSCLSHPTTKRLQKACVYIYILNMKPLIFDSGRMEVYNNNFFFRSLYGRRSNRFLIGGQWNLAVFANAWSLLIQVFKQYAAWKVSDVGCCRTPASGYY